MWYVRVPYCLNNRFSLSDLVAVVLSVCSGGVAMGVNPKINNMTPAYRAAKYNLIWMNDSSLTGWWLGWLV